MATLSSRHRVWALTVVLAAMATAVAVRLPVAAPPGAPRLPWILLVVGFCAAEVCVVHVHARGDAHSFSLSEVPLILGLFTATPRDVIIAQAVGAALALIVHRRQWGQKLAFNLAQFALCTTVASALFHAVSRPTPFQPRGWMVAGLAALVSAIVGAAATATVISLVQGRLRLERFSTIASLVVIGATANGSLGVLAAWFAWRDPSALWLLLLPSVALLLAYRAFIRERQRLEDLRFVHESTRILHASPELDQSILAVLQHTCEMARAELAEIVLFPSSEEKPAVRWRVEAGGEAHSTDTVALSGADLYLAAAAVRGDTATLTAAREDSALRPLLEARGIRDAVVAGLQTDTAMLGLLIVGNRLGDVAPFDREDVRLIDTLGRHMAVAFQNGQLERSLAQLRSLQDRLAEQAFHDSLTGLANRALLRDRIEHALRRKGGEAVAVLFIDLDDFKTVNDSLGHAAGDQLLVAVAGRLRGCLRPTDIPARLGGDEFAVFLQDPGGLGEAMSVAERIIDSLQSPFHLQESSVHVGASVGIAMGTPSEKTADVLLSDADLAMYTAKLNGKGSFEIFQPCMRVAVQQRHTLKTRLQRAIANQEFVVHYQPIVGLPGYQISGAEALVRWQPPEEEMLFPDAFIPLAEETGLINEIGWFVLRRACRDAMRWQAASGQPVETMSVNISPRQLKDPTFVDQVTEALRQSGMPARSLMLEITETTLLQDSESSVDKLQDLRQLGVRLAIDDFGTGYSSMSYLRRFPIDVLKVAKPFVDGLGTSAANPAFAEAIVRMGQSLGLRLIAEGIADPRQATALERMGCDFGQGFLFGPAVPADALPPVGGTARPVDEVAPVPVGAAILA